MASSPTPGCWYLVRVWPMPRTSRFGDLLHIGYPTADCVLLASLDAFFAFFCHLAEVNIGSCNYWILVVFVSMCICDLEGPKIEQRLTSILGLFFLSFFLRIYSYRIIKVYRWGARWSLVYKSAKHRWCKDLGRPTFLGTPQSFARRMPSATPCIHLCGAHGDHFNLQ